MIVAALWTASSMQTYWYTDVAHSRSAFAGSGPWWSIDCWHQQSHCNGKRQTKNKWETGKRKLRPEHKPSLFLDGHPPESEQVGMQVSIELDSTQQYVSIYLLKAALPKYQASLFFSPCGVKQGAITGSSCYIQQEDESSFCQQWHATQWDGWQWHNLWQSLLTDTGCCVLVSVRAHAWMAISKDTCERSVQCRLKTSTQVAPAATCSMPS